MNTQPKNYGELADIINKCDENDVPILINASRGNIDMHIPVDNFEWFKDVTSHSPDDICPIGFTYVDNKLFVNI